MAEGTTRSRGFLERFRQRNYNKPAGPHDPNPVRRPRAEIVSSPVRPMTPA